MINLSEMLNQKNQNHRKSGGQPIVIRDKLLLKEVQEMEDNLPQSASISFPDANILYSFNVIVKPNEGYWATGQFKFIVEIPEAYNNAPPLVKCLTKIWHPNIDEDGRVCLSMLRQTSIDSSGWAPTRRLKDMVWGIDSLFGDLCDFNDALNTTAAEQYNFDKETFKRRVQRYINEYARR